MRTSFIAVALLFSLASPAAATEEVPFKGTLDGVVTITPIQPPVVSILIEGTGNATHPDKYAIVFTAVVNQATRTGTATCDPSREWRHDHCRRERRASDACATGHPVDGRPRDHHGRDRAVCRCDRQLRYSARVLRARGRDHWHIRRDDLIAGGPLGAKAPAVAVEKGNASGPRSARSRASPAAASPWRRPLTDGRGVVQLPAA